MLAFYTDLIGILLCLEHLIRQFKILSDQLGAFFLLLLDLADEIPDHILLRDQLLRHPLISFHRQLAFVNDRKMNIPNVAHLVNYRFQIRILLFQFNIFLHDIRQL